MRLYIINATELIPLAQKHYRILDFAPVEAKVAINVMGASPAGKKILVKNVNGIEDFSYAILFDKAIHPAVSPGPGLHDMNRKSVENVLRLVDILAQQAPRKLKLFQTFESEIITFLLNLWPNILAREAVQARKDLVEAFHEYFVTDSHKQGSAFVQAHYQHKVGQGIAGRDIARFEIGGVNAVLGNTIPTAFWVLYHTITDEDVLRECRREVLACCNTNGDTFTLDVSQLKDSCALLISVLKETLRFHGIGTSVRLVTQDHMLDGKYLLKKGGIVMIPGAVQHTSVPAFGDDVNEFRHNRFMRSPGIKKPSPVAFRGFGTGTTLCPGRHFASTELLTFVALMIVRFDFEPTQGSWICPTTANARAHSTVAPPDNDIEVYIAPPANDLSDKKWVAVVPAANEGVKLAVEDS
ncbi:cytochrome P450 [Paraphoma chrysanthemicola]|nr:cytochrome P450 [Paraphoma chrysanthemicola]